MSLIERHTFTRVYNFYPETKRLPHPLFQIQSTLQPLYVTRPCMRSDFTTEEFQLKFIINHLKSNDDCNFSMKTVFYSIVILDLVRSFSDDYSIMSTLYRSI